MKATTGLRSSKNQRGAALMTVMIILLLVCAVGSAVVTFAKQQAYSVARVTDFLKAQAYAEAGANEAYSLLKTNWALRTESSRFPLTTFEDGTYDATIGSVTSNRASITCVGVSGPCEATVQVDIQNFGSGTPASDGSSPDAFDYSMVSGGRIWLQGNGTLDMGDGKAHANKQYDHSGTKFIIGNVESSEAILLSGAVQITGKASAPVINDPSKIVGETVVGSVPKVHIPNIDLTPYYNAALANGQVFTVAKKKVTASPPGGIMWVNGELSVENGAAIEGSFFATGNIKVTANGSVSKVNKYPLLVSRDGDIEIASIATMKGLIYTKTGTIRKTGNGVIEGNIVANGDVEGAGGWDYLVYADSTPVGPDGSTPGTSADKVVPMAWQR